jgi:hypothetical protein
MNFFSSGKFQMSLIAQWQSIYNHNKVSDWENRQLIYNLVYYKSRPLNSVGSFTFQKIHIYSERSWVCLFLFVQISPHWKHEKRKIMMLTRAKHNTGVHSTNFPLESFTPRQNGWCFSLIEKERQVFWQQRTQFMSKRRCSLLHFLDPRLRRAKKWKLK